MLSRIVRFSEPRAQRVALALLILVLLVAGAAYSLHLGDRLRFGDETGYYGIAHNLAMRGWYSEDSLSTTAYRAPGYPFLLWPLLSMHLPIAGLRFFNFLALAGSLIVAYLLLRRHGFAAAGLLAALMLAVYPVLFYTAGTLYPQTLGVFFVLLTVWLLSGVRTREVVFAGLAFGFLILLIPSMLLLLIVFALLPAFLRRPKPWWLGVLFVVVSLLTVAPWTARNALVFHRFIPISTNGGLNLLLGNSEHAGPDTGYMADISRYTSQADRMSETEKDNFYRNQALRWMKVHPSQAANLYVRKALNGFSYHNRMDTKGVNSRATDLLMFVTYVPLLLLFLVRWALVRRYPPTPLESFIAVCYVADALVTALFFTRIRFRLPFDALLICADALFLQSVWRTHRGTASRHPGFSAHGR